MSDTNGPEPEPAGAADEPFFQALLTPHRSLGRTGFLILMGTLLFGWTLHSTVHRGYLGGALGWSF